ncbi:MAG: 3D domain-containing protein [Bacillota bacterium]|nr:3D domain-containing protein [Bacillota bacterium]
MKLRITSFHLIIIIIIELLLIAALVVVLVLNKPKVKADSDKVSLNYSETINPEVLRKNTPSKNITQNNGVGLNTSTRNTPVKVNSDPNNSVGINTKKKSSDTNNSIPISSRNNLEKNGASSDNSSLSNSSINNPNLNNSSLDNSIHSSLSPDGSLSLARLDSEQNDSISGKASEINPAQVNSENNSSIQNSPIKDSPIQNNSIKDRPIRAAYTSLLPRTEYDFVKYLYSSLWPDNEPKEFKLPGKQPKTDEFIATAYDLSYESCGKYPWHPQYGITFSGKKAVRGRTVAVDPDVIPLGSEIYMTFPQKYDYLNGWYVAEDTGSKVKGKIIDIYMGQSAFYEMEKFGSMKVNVKIVYPEFY